MSVKPSMAAVVLNIASNAAKLAPVGTALRAAIALDSCIASFACSP
jgi:hypothetical protein